MSVRVNIVASRHLRGDGYIGQSSGLEVILDIVGVTALDTAIVSYLVAGDDRRNGSVAFEPLASTTSVLVAVLEVRFGNYSETACRVIASRLEEVLNDRRTLFDFRQPLAGGSREEMPELPLPPTR